MSGLSKIWQQKVIGWMGHMTDEFLHGRIVPQCGRIQVTSVQGRRIQRPHGTYVTLSGFQGILNGNNLCPTVNPNHKVPT